jgi:site-specific DNA recombinase
MIPERIALYARVSTASQAEAEKVSLPTQIADIEAFCQEKGFEIVDRYVDAGYSGATKKRPEFQRILKDAEAGKFDTIVCWKSDRISRGMYPAAALMEVIEPKGIELKAVKETIDMNTFAIMAIVGKWNSIT